MIDFKLYYQASAFFEPQQISATPKKIAELMTLFLERELLPSSLKEVNERGIHNSFSLESSSKEWKISFLNSRILIEKKPTNIKGTNLGEFSVFCDEVTSILDKIFNYMPQKACRLSVASSFLLRTMSEIQLHKLYELLFKAPEIYQNNPPFEWDWRSVAQLEKEILGEKEQLNFITEIKRLTGEIHNDNEAEVFDGIRLSFDINTSQKNLTGRFDLSHVVDFMGDVPNWYFNLLEETTKFIEPCL